MKIFTFLLILFCIQNIDAQQPKKKKVPPPFKWVNEIPTKLKIDGLSHGTFKSESMGLDVGYCVFLPSEYKSNSSKRYPVVYYLHGGRPGSEIKSIRLVPHISKAMNSGKINPAIYVFVNGGPVSHYNLPERKNHMGEDVFVKELIPHIDKTYRTIANRANRGLEGFSQGGRGTSRIMFKYPDLFSSCAPGGAGYETEKRISENNGEENPKLIFAKGYNTWDLARKYNSELRGKYPLKIQIHVGTKGFNYENNLGYMKFLESLSIPYSSVIVEDAPHSASKIYEGRGQEIMKFHSDNFAKAK